MVEQLDWKVVSQVSDRNQSGFKENSLVAAHASDVSILNEENVMYRNGTRRLFLWLKR